MEYKGKLYGKVGKTYFPLLKTASEVDKLEKENAEMLEMLKFHVDGLDLSDFEFYNKYGFNVSEVFPRTRELIKQATEL